MLTRVFTTFRILEISYISNVFFVSYTIRKWPKFREIIRNFSVQIYTKFRGILRNSVTCYANFFLRFSTDDIFYTQQRNFKMLIGGGGCTTIHPSTPTPSLGWLRHFVYSKFCIFRMFFCFVYHSKIYFSDPDSNFNFFCFYTVLILNTVQDFKDICY